MTAARHASWHTARVVARRAETRTAQRIELGVASWPGNDAGSHVDVRLTAPDGYQATRSYSLASSGDEPRLVLVVDEVASGEVSPFLVHELAEGDDIEVHGPLGRFFVWTPSDPDPAPVQLIAGGSGVVPLYAMAAAREHAEVGTEFRLLYSVRSPGDVFFADDLAGFTETTVHTVYTRRSPEGATRPPGRLTPAVIAESAFPASVRPRVFVCGPTPFVEAVADWLLELGHEPERIRTERFGGTS